MNFNRLVCKGESGTAHMQNTSHSGARQMCCWQCQTIFGGKKFAAEPTAALLQPPHQTYVCFHSQAFLITHLDCCLNKGPAECVFPCMSVHVCVCVLSTQLSQSQLQYVYVVSSSTHVAWKLFPLNLMSQCVWLWLGEWKIENETGHKSFALVCGRQLVLNAIWWINTTVPEYVCVWGGWLQVTHLDWRDNSDLMSYEGERQSASISTFHQSTVSQNTHIRVMLGDNKSNWLISWRTTVGDCCMCYWRESQTEQ